MDEKSEFLPNVYGYGTIKKELQTIREWYLDLNTMGDKAKLLPRGIIFHGDPGTGKTHLMREYAKSFGCPIHVIEGNAEDVQKEVIDTYKKAREEGLSIVIIDELDRLIENDQKLTRILQNELDGFNSQVGVITLTSANDYDRIPETLLRDGRLDRHFLVMLRDMEDTRNVIKGFLKDAGVSLAEEQIDELAMDMRLESPVLIRSSINSAVLFVGKSCDSEDIFRYKHFHKSGRVPFIEDIDVVWPAAIHEAGHACYIYFYSKVAKVGRIHFGMHGGVTTSSTLKKYCNVKTFNDTIRTALAGLVAEEIIIGYHETGSWSDIERAHSKTFSLLNNHCIEDIRNYYTSSSSNEIAKDVSQFRLARLERRCDKYLKKQYKTTKRLLRKHKKDILALASFVYEHKEATNADILRILSRSKSKSGALDKREMTMRPAISTELY